MSDRPYPVLDLFSGYAGFSLAFEAVADANDPGCADRPGQHRGGEAPSGTGVGGPGGSSAFRTIGFSEIEPYACALLAHRFPGVPNLGPVQSVTRDRVLRECGVLPVVVTGGFPCQPHSHAGKRLASEDERDLWAECGRVLRELRPRVALFENVPGLLSSESGLFFNRVLSDLAELGFACSWETLSAADLGAITGEGPPHKRERIWLLCVDERGVDDTAGAGLQAQRTGTSQQGQGSIGSRGAKGELAHGESGGRGERGATGGSERGGHTDGEGAGGGELADPASERAGGRSGVRGTERGPGSALLGESGATGEEGSGLADTCPSGLPERGVERGVHPGAGEPDQGQDAPVGYQDGAFWPAAHGLWPARPGEAQYEWEPAGSWATPRTITGGPESAQRKQELGRTESGGGDLQSQVQAAGKLSPAWVSCLMGLPMGWVALPYKFKNPKKAR